MIWLQLDTPDFELFARRDSRTRRRKGPRTEVRRLVFGLDPKSKEPQLVLVAPERAGPLQVPGSVLVQCTDWIEQGPPGSQARLPGRFFAYETPLPEGRSGPPRFSDTAM